MAKCIPLFLISTFLFFGCTLDSLSSDQFEFKVLTYNVQNIMDDQLDGFEYDEYKPSKTWTTQAYHQRLKTLSEVVSNRAIGLCDVLVFQEVEHENVVRDLLERHLARKGYQWYAVAKEEGGAISIAIASREKPIRVVVHTVIGARPILEAVFDTPSGEVVVFALHAKSQLGEYSETEALRLELARSLSQATRKYEGSNVLICGDFNEDPDAYSKNSLVQTALIETRWQVSRTFMANGSLGISGMKQNIYSDIWYSPFLDQSNTFSKPGSYWYGGTWHHYDQFLGNGSLFDDRGWEYDSCDIVVPPICLNTDGTPKAWNLATLCGVSDHFPVLLTLKRK